VRQLAPHINIGEHESGRVFLEIGDYELFDFLDDFFVDECDLLYESRTGRPRPGGEIITMYFPVGVKASRIEECILRLSVSEIERIYSLNNP